jgi:hypothetical protein
LALGGGVFELLVELVDLLLQLVPHLLVLPGPLAQVPEQVLDALDLLDDEVELTMEVVERGFEIDGGWVNYIINSPVVNRLNSILAVPAFIAFEAAALSPAVP